MPKSEYIPSKFKLTQIDVVSKVYFDSTVSMLKLTLDLLFLEPLPKKYAKLQQKVN